MRWVHFSKKGALRGRSSCTSTVERQYFGTGSGFCVKKVGNLLVFLTGFL